MNDNNADNVVSLGFAPSYPEVRRLMRELAEVLNNHVQHVPVVAVIGALDMIKQDLTMQAMELGEE